MQKLPKKNVLNGVKSESSSVWLFNNGCLSGYKLDCTVPNEYCSCMCASTKGHVLLRRKETRLVTKSELYLGLL